MDTITRLINAVAQRDKLQFPSTYTDEERREYGEEYVLNMLRELVRHDPDLDAYFETRVALIEGDIETAETWRPQQ